MYLTRIKDRHAKTSAGIQVAKIIPVQVRQVAGLCKMPSEEHLGYAGTSLTK